MEVKSFQWLLDSLASSQSDIPVLDCYTFANAQKALHYCRNDRSAYSCSTEMSHISDILWKVYREYTLLHRLDMTSNICCFIFQNNKKRIVLYSEFQELVQNEQELSSITCIGIPKPNPAHTNLLCYVNIELAGNKYSTSFSILKKQGKEPLLDEMLCKQAAHIAKKLIALMNSHVKQTLSSLELELLRDGNNVLWISDATITLTPLESHRRRQNQSHRDAGKLLSANSKPTRLSIPPRRPSLKRKKAMKSKTFVKAVTLRNPHRRGLTMHDAKLVENPYTQSSKSCAKFLSPKKKLVRVKSVKQVSKLLNHVQGGKKNRPLAIALDSDFFKRSI